MHRHTILILITAISVAIVLALPLYLKFIAYPAYEQFLVHNVEQEMQVLAGQMVKDHQFPTPISLDVPLPAKFIEDVEYIQRTVGLPKIKIFSKEGIIVYSTDPADRGIRTSQDFFPMMLADRLPRTELKVIKGADKNAEIQMIETYVPIYDNGHAVGAFEIYRDITGLRQTFHRQIHEERVILLPVIILLLAGGLFSSYLAYTSMAELKQARDQFQELSVTDALTGLMNRRGYTTAVEKQLSMLNRSGNNALLLYIDMDGFKLINDKFGHLAGDQALVETAGILKNTFRTSDVIGRIGGDEFSVLTITHHNSSDEMQVTQRLLENLANWNSRRTVGYELSFSIGIVGHTPDSPCTVDELINYADAKMYAEKQRKKSGMPASS